LLGIETYPTTTTTNIMKARLTMKRYADTDEVDEYSELPPDFILKFDGYSPPIDYWDYYDDEYPPRPPRPPPRPLVSPEIQAVYDEYYYTEQKIASLCMTCKDTTVLQVALLLFPEPYKQRLRRILAMGFTIHTRYEYGAQLVLDGNYITVYDILALGKTYWPDFCPFLHRIAPNIPYFQCRPRELTQKCDTVPDYWDC